MHLLRVPLVIRAPSRVPAGTRVRQTVSLRDISATVLDLVDSRADEGPQVGGQSLRGLWDSTAVRRPSPAIAALTVVAPVRGKNGPNWDLHSIVDDSLHYIRNREGKELLFDVRTDPDEWNNLGTTEAGRILSAQMRARMDSALRALR
jgi:arylsulfatase A-like enzyme